MKFSVTGLALALTVALAGTGLVAADDGPNDAQHGEGDCLDYLALFLVPGVTSPDVDAAVVEAGSDFEITTSDGDAVSIDFYDENGASAGYSFEATGTVPDGAVTATICVETVVETPFGNVFVPTGGAWTYQDGF
jgi:hypothetical protein